MAYLLLENYWKQYIPKLFRTLHRSRENRDCHADFLVHQIESEHGDQVSSFY